MLKTIQIGNEAVTFKVSSSLVFRFQAQTGKDLLKIVMPLLKELMKGDELTNEAVLDAAEKHIELTDLYTVIWIMAKTADDSIGDPTEWLDSFEEFHVWDIAQELFPAMAQSLFASEKSKKKLAQMMKKK